VNRYGATISRCCSVFCSRSGMARITRRRRWVYGEGTAALKLNFGLTSGHELRRAQHVPKSVTPTIDGAVAGSVFVDR
jgi:hypothetical protein